MRVGTDAVLLGAWTELPPRTADSSLFRVLEIGCGCGLVSLMLAQRLQEAALPGKPFGITAVDIHSPSCLEAARNVSCSPWKDEIEVKNLDFLELPEDFEEEAFALLVSNPPFFRESLKSPDPARNLARHNDTLPFAPMLAQAERLLKEGGTLSLILPPGSFVEIGRILEETASPLRLRRQTDVCSKAGKSPVRVLACWQKVSCPAQSPVISHDRLILRENDAYTAAYRALVKDFYLWA